MQGLVLGWPWFRSLSRHWEKESDAALDKVGNMSLTSSLEANRAQWRRWQSVMPLRLSTRREEVKWVGALAKRSMWIRTNFNYAIRIFDDRQIRCNKIVNLADQGTCLLLHVSSFGNRLRRSGRFPRNRFSTISVHRVDICSSRSRWGMCACLTRANFFALLLVLLVQDVAF